MKPLKGKLILSLLAFAVLTLGSAMTARADIIIVSGNNPQPDENVIACKAVVLTVSVIAPSEGWMQTRRMASGPASRVAVFMTPL